MNQKQTVLSGIRATGRLHLGNYFGAVKGMLELAQSGKYDTYFMVVDLHTLTTPYDKTKLKESVRDIIIDYLAAGLDPAKSALFIQSMVPEHAELAFYFSTVTTVAKMQHLPTFKDKVKQHPENVTMALLNYPVLMAADILMYKAASVPVGVDQEPHLEVAREIARRMNQDYGTDFPEPKRFATKGGYVPSLLGEGKMSKSVEGSYINLSDDLETIRKKVAKVPTASAVGGQKTPGIETLFSLLQITDSDRIEEFEKSFADGTLKFSELKEYVSQKIFEQIKPIQERREQLLQNPEYIDQVIADGAKKARAKAQETIAQVKRQMGLV